MSKKREDRFAVWFNSETKALHHDLHKKGLTSQSFSDFVKTAFHEKVDDLRQR